MYISWKQYILHHKSNKDLNDNITVLQQKFATATSEQLRFTEMAKFKSLLCLTRTPFSQEIQITFHHAEVTASVQQTHPYYLGLTGFGHQARAIRLDIAHSFKRTTATKKVPSYKDLIECDSIDTIRQLRSQDTPKVSLDYFTFIPPKLASTIIESESLQAEDLLLKLIRAIRGLRTTADDVSVLLDPEDMMANDPTGDSVVSSMSDAPISDADLVTESEKFHKILQFLWAVMKDDIAGSPIILCSKKDTKKWEDEQHESHIKRQAQSTPTILPQPPSQDHTAALNQNIIELTNAITAEKIPGVKSQDDEEGNGWKKFKKLPLVTRNVIRLLTITEDTYETDLPDLKPTENMLEIIAAGSPGAIIQNIHLYFASNGNLCNPEPAAGTALKHGFLCSIPNANSINVGLCVFLYPHESYGEALSAEKMMQLAEQAGSNQKYDHTDLKLLTDIKVTIPKSYDSFFHMLKNIHFVTQHLGGPQCIGALAWESAIDHARNNERVYRDQAKQNPDLYLSILNDYHRRFMTFLISCGFGKWNKIQTRQLHFERIFEGIKEETYIIRTPSWAKLLAPKRLHSQISTEPHPGSVPSTPVKRARLERNKRVVNPNFDEELSVPHPLTFQQIFSLENRRKITPALHDDGSIKCNNYHHRGYCRERGCHYAHSHTKTLSAKEKVAAKNFLHACIAKFNAEKNNTDPAVPNGLPPKKTSEAQPPITGSKG